MLIAVREKGAPEMTVFPVMPGMRAGVLRDRKPTVRADAGRLTPAVVSAVRAGIVPQAVVRVTADIPGAGPAVSRTIRARVCRAEPILTAQAVHVTVTPDTQRAAEAVSRTMLTRAPACRAVRTLTVRAVHVTVIPDIPRVADPA